jgi:putative oxidoreductase
MKLPHASFWMGPNGFAPPWLQAVVTYAELIGGICLILGLATALFAFILSIDMLVAIFKFHIPAGGHFVGGPGPSFEVPLVYLVVLVALLIAGPGNFSVDALFRRRRRRNG